MERSFCVISQPLPFFRSVLLMSGEIATFIAQLFNEKKIPNTLSPDEQRALVDDVREYATNPTNLTLLLIVYLGESNNAVFTAITQRSWFEETM